MAIKNNALENTKYLKNKYFENFYKKYSYSSNQEKRIFLDVACYLWGYHRKHAVAKFKQYILRIPRTKNKSIPVSHKKYTTETMWIIRTVWELEGKPGYFKLKKVLKSWLPFVKRHFNPSPEAEKQLLTISYCTIERFLQKVRSEYKKRL